MFSKLNITNSGANLSVLIQDAGRDSWASFAGWYSINRYLPDAQMIVCRPRTITPMTWTTRCGIKVINYKPEDYQKTLDQHQDFLILPSYTALIRSLRDDDSFAVEDCKVSTTPFVRFFQCGRFDANVWNQHETRPAILFVDKLRSEMMTQAEIKVLDLLSNMKNAFLAMER